MNQKGRVNWAYLSAGLLTFISAAIVVAVGDANLQFYCAGLGPLWGPIGIFLIIAGLDSSVREKLRSDDSTE